MVLVKLYMFYLFCTPHIYDYGIKRGEIQEESDFTVKFILDILKNVLTIDGKCVRLFLA